MARMKDVAIEMEKNGIQVDGFDTYDTPTGLRLVIFSEGYSINLLLSTDMANGLTDDLEYALGREDLGDVVAV